MVTASPSGTRFVFGLGVKCGLSAKVLRIAPLGQVNNHDLIHQIGGQSLLDNKESRDNLEVLRAENSRADPTFLRVKNISRAFEESLDHIFFENAHLKPLTRKYGVF